MHSENQENLKVGNLTQYQVWLLQQPYLLNLVVALQVENEHELVDGPKKIIQKINLVIDLQK